MVIRSSASFTPRLSKATRRYTRPDDHIYTGNVTPRSCNIETRFVMELMSGSINTGTIYLFIAAVLLGLTSVGSLSRMTRIECDSH